MAIQDFYTLNSAVVNSSVTKRKNLVKRYVCSPRHKYIKNIDHEPDQQYPCTERSRREQPALDSHGSYSSRRNSVGYALTP